MSTDNDYATYLRWWVNEGSGMPPQRPDCFESAMEFLDEPEAPVLLAYVEALEARVALAQPEPQMPTDEELLRTYGKAKRDYRYEGPLDDWPKQAERAATVHGLRAVLALIRRPAIQPIPVSERPLEREGWCDAQGRCWVGEPESDYSLGESGDFDMLPPEWKLVDPTLFASSARPIFLLPHWALPLPAPTTTEAS